MFVSILLRDLVRDFGVEFESLGHRESFEISTDARGQKTIGSHHSFCASLLRTQFHMPRHSSSARRLSTDVNSDRADDH